MNVLSIIFPHSNAVSMFDDESSIGDVDFVTSRSTHSRITTESRQQEDRCIEELTNIVKNLLRQKYTDIQQVLLLSQK